MTDRFEAVLRSPYAGPWRSFSNPIRVVRAAAVGEVRAALGDVEQAVHGGLYAAGFVLYEAAAAFGLPVRSEPSALPLVCFGLFPPEHVDSQVRLPGAGDAQIEIGEWATSIDHDGYLQAIRVIKERIEAGDTYQINFTFRLTAPCRGEPLALMADLYAAQAGRWSAFVDTGTHAICSASPELFFLQDQGRIECRPMKGTAARGWWPAQDLARAEALQQSDKNRSENVMIVDMVRNDLGRIAATGSVRAVSLFDVERYPLQWQMTSSIEAEARVAGVGSLFAAMFPSGSISGTPKHSAMEIIRTLESTPRGIYTGAVGYVSPHGRSHFNVAIRTVAIDREKEIAEFGVGSGIVWDSSDRDEYDECLIKANMLARSRSPVPGSRFEVPGSRFPVQGSRLRESALRVPSYIVGEHPDFRLLETIRWDPGVGFRLLDRHLRRLKASAACFAFPSDLVDFGQLLNEAVENLTRPAKIRLLLDGHGSVLCEALDLEPAPDGEVTAALAAEAIDPADIFLFHKTTRRGVYERARASRPDAGAVILWNTAGEVTEATDFNVVVEFDGRKVTPPLDCGLLPGTMREALLEAGDVAERRITVDELRSAGHGWLINSVRGWIPFTL
jgi:para-aminobenzoate synthetase/4-amino-4-deoxychorismate lyase